MANITNTLQLVNRVNSDIVPNGARLISASIMNDILSGSAYIIDNLSGSFNNRINNITSTGFVSTASFNSFTASINNFSSSVIRDSASFDSRINTSLNTSIFVNTASFNSYTSSINNWTSSINSYTSSVNSLNVWSSSINTYTASLVNKLGIGYVHFYSGSSVFTSSMIFQHAGGNILFGTSSDNNNFTFSYPIQSVKNIIVYNTSNNGIGLNNNNTFDSKTGPALEFYGSTLLRAFIRRTAGDGIEFYTNQGASNPLSLISDRVLINTQLTSTHSLVVQATTINTLNTAVAWFRGTVSGAAAINGGEFITLAQYNSLSGSGGSTGSIDTSGLVTTSSFNNYTSSTNNWTSSINSYTSSFNRYTSSINVWSSSINSYTNSLNTWSSSINSYTSSLVNKLSPTYVPFYSGSNVFSSSVIYQTGSNILIGTLNDLGYKLNVTNSINVQGEYYANNQRILGFNPNTNIVSLDPQGFGVDTNFFLRVGSYLRANTHIISPNIYSQGTTDGPINTAYAGFYFARSNDIAGPTALGGITGIWGNPLFDRGLSLGFNVSSASNTILSGTSGSEAMRLTFNGNLIINMPYTSETQGGGYKLQVAGRGLFTGSVQGAPATQSSEFITLGQYSSLSSSVNISGLVTTSSFNSYTSSLVNKLGRNYIPFYSGSNEFSSSLIYQASASNNILIGTTTDNSLGRLQILGSIYASEGIRSQTGTFVNNSLLTYVSNWGGSAGYIGFGFVNTLTPAVSDTIFNIYQSPSSSPSNLFNFGHTYSDNIISSGSHAIININTIINQINNSNIIRGIYYNPTLLSVSGTHNAIETTTGDIVFNGGKVNIGLSGSNDKLQVSGSIRLKNTVWNNEQSSSISGSNYSILTLTQSYDSIFYNYVITSGSIKRAGQIMSIWSSSNTTYSEQSTNTLGGVLTASFSTEISASYIILRVNTTSPNCIIKTSYNLL